MVSTRDFDSRGQGSNPCRSAMKHDYYEAWKWMVETRGYKGTLEDLQQMMAKAKEKRNKDR